MITILMPHLGIYAPFLIQRSRIVLRICSHFRKDCADEPQIKSTLIAIRERDYLFCR